MNAIGLMIFRFCSETASIQEYIYLILQILAKGSLKKKIIIIKNSFFLFYIYSIYHVFIIFTISNETFLIQPLVNLKMTNFVFTEQTKYEKVVLPFGQFHYLPFYEKSMEIYIMEGARKF